jgi:hypothetical protein
MLDEMIKLQKMRVFKLWTEFCGLVGDNKMKEADKFMNKYYLKASHILFMMENKKREK